MPSTALGKAMTTTSRPDSSGPHPRLKAVRAQLADLGKILLSEVCQLLVQVAIPACLLIALAGGMRAGQESDERHRFLYFDVDHMVGTPLASAESDVALADEPDAAAAQPRRSALDTLLRPAVWRNRIAFIYPSLRDTSLLLLSGLASAAAFACLLVVPALRTRSPGVRTFLAVVDEFGLLLCCVPVFVAGFVIRLEVPPHGSRALYYCMAALTLGIGNLTLAEMIQMLRSRLQDEVRLPYFDLIEVRGFTMWRRLVHRLKPYMRAAILSLCSKVPILFSSVVIIEIILSLPVSGLSPIEKGLGLVAKEAAEAGDGVTLLWIVFVVAVWIRAFSFLAEAVTYFALWNPKQE